MADIDSSYDVVIGPFYDRAGVAALVHLDGDVFEAAITERRLIALQMAVGHMTFPTWQFDSSGVVDADMVSMWAMLAAAAGDGWTAAAWMRSPNRDLGGQTAVGWLAAGGDLAPARAAATACARRWSQ